MGWLQGSGTDGLIALSGVAGGDVGQALASGNAAAAETLARAPGRSCFPGRYYLEAAARRASRQPSAGRRARLRSRRSCELPVVATHPVQFLAPDDFKAHEARVCIAQGYVLGDQRRPKLFTPEQYFKTQAEMAKLFADLPQALENAVEIARRCNLEIELGKSRLPAFPDAAREFRSMTSCDSEAAKGLARRIEKLKLEDEETPRYRERLEFEIKTIVADGLRRLLPDRRRLHQLGEARTACRSGRGAARAPGSLVAYALGITDLDPLRYDLLFERFLNPERVSMPDFDIDFCQDGRDRVIDYVRKKYGEDCVSQIATFGTMAARAVVRDVGRVLDLGYNFCDQIAKLIPFQPGKHDHARRTRARWSRCSPSARRRRTRCASCSSSARSSRA